MTPKTKNRQTIGAPADSALTGVDHAALVTYEDCRCKGKRTIFRPKTEVLCPACHSLEERYPTALVEAIAEGFTRVDTKPYRDAEDPRDYFLELAYEALTAIDGYRGLQDAKAGRL